MSSQDPVHVGKVPANTPVVGVLMTHTKNIDDLRSLARKLGRVVRQVGDNEGNIRAIIFYEDDWYQYTPHAREWTVEQFQQCRMQYLLTQEVAHQEGGHCVRVVHALHIAEIIRRLPEDFCPMQIHHYLLGGGEKCLYDAPKLVFALVQLACSEPDVAHIRVDADVDISVHSVRNILMAWAQVPAS